MGRANVDKDQKLSVMRRMHCLGLRSERTTEGLVPRYHAVSHRRPPLLSKKMYKTFSSQDLLREPALKLLEESYIQRQRGVTMRGEVEVRKAQVDAQKRQREERGERKSFDAKKLMRMFGGAIKVEKRVLDKGAGVAGAASGSPNAADTELEEIEDTSPELLRDAEVLRTAALASTLYRAEKDILYASSRFLKTTAKPPLFWKPKLYTRRYEREIDRQEDRLEDDIKPFKKRMLGLIEDVMDSKEEGESSSSSSSRRGDAKSSSASASARRDGKE